MRDGLRGCVLGLACLVLASCSGGSENRLANSDTSELLGLLQLGRPVLGCREACLDEWKRVQPKAVQFDATAQWSDLAVLVIRSGYQDDLSLYYLGRAAEGMGFYAASASYYRQSMQLSGTSISCANLSRLCGGVALPKSASEHLAAAERMLVPGKPPPVRSRTNPPLPPAQPAAAAEPAPTAEPAATPTPPPVAIPPPPPSAPPIAAPADASRTGATDYIEPPPAAR